MTLKSERISLQFLCADSKHVILTVLTRMMQGVVWELYLRSTMVRSSSYVFWSNNKDQKNQFIIRIFLVKRRNLRFINICSSIVLRANFQSG